MANVITEAMLAASVSKGCERPFAYFRIRDHEPI